MATFVSIPAYRKELQRKIKELKKDQTRSPAKAASYMVLQAKRRAPRYSGQTIQGIRRKKSGKSYTVNHGFLVHLNRTYGLTRHLHSVRYITGKVILGLVSRKELELSMVKLQVILIGVVRLGFFT